MPLFNPSTSVPYRHSMGANPPASPITGDRWSRTVGNSALSLDGWDWVWDGVHWISPTQRVTASIWNSTGNTFFGILASGPYAIKNRRLFLNVFIAQPSPSGQAGTITALMWNGETKQWNGYGELWFTDAIVNDYRLWQNTQAFVVPINANTHNLLALNMWPASMAASFYGTMGLEYTFIY